ncbi:hypothetical protein CC77DRAFT_370798 [Alternaria alternata]|uniref:Secreted protein n=1 Tax=Alternaria alternata TaxID=5599 RepID=A0A177DBG1_ALTAL|nr:hypothetical protein CC77DRAFT_370798 [Alternaria alternata]OAG17005.1 hypothetical protein CC77DRAFT_370798 [Alternaria alternata]
MSALVMILAALKLGTVPTIPQSAIRVQQHGSDSGACQERVLRSTKNDTSQFARALRRGVSADCIFTRRANTIDKGSVS